MGAMSIGHWVIVVAVVVLLFGGKNKISALMKDIGGGFKNARKAIKEMDES